MTPQTIPAESDQICHCCGRKHRKLYRVDRYWLGQNCAQSYRIYKRTPDVTSFVWRGWETKHAQIKRMVTGVQK